MKRLGSLLVFCVGTTLPAGNGQAATIFDSFDAGGTFHPQFNGVAAAGHTDMGPYAGRLAVQFTVSDTGTLTSITLPISFQGDTPGTLRVRLTENAGGYPGTTLEVLSENETWPIFANPFTTKTTLTSVTRPLLSAGASYWIVTELTSFPAGSADYRWFYSTSGPSVPFLYQQDTTGSLPSDPWTGATGGTARYPLHVEGDVVPATEYHTVTPCRLVDSRVGSPSPLLAGETRAIAAAGSCNIPTGASALALSIAVTQPTAPGHLRLFPTGQPLPLVSTLNYSAGQTRTSNAIAGLDASGSLSVYCSQASGSAHFVVDVTGYFIESAGADARD